MLAAYEKALRQLYTPEINKLLIDLRQYKQRINRFLDANAASAAMKEEEAKAKEASTAASCRIDGVSVSEKRLHELMDGSMPPKTRKEREVAGYRFTLNTIDDSYPYIRISTGAICQLHRDLYRYLDVPFAGRWEDVQETLVRKKEVGKVATRLASTVIITKQTMLRDACTNYKQAIDRQACDPLVAVCMFALDVINIHPFAEGVGRLSRLLTLLTMFQNDYFVASYVSLAEQMERTKPAYVKAIEAGRRVVPEGGSEDDAETNYEPFVRYLLEAMLACCQRFEKDHDLGPAPAEQAAPRDATAAGKAEAKRTRNGKQPEMSREERMRQRAILKTHADEALNNPPRLSQTGMDLLASKEGKAAGSSKQAASISTTPRAFQQTRSQSSSPWVTPAPVEPQDSPADRQNQGESRSSKKPSESAKGTARHAKTGGKHPGKKGNLTNEETVREYFRTLEGSASKREIAAACPGMSAKTVERMVQKFLAEGYVEKIGAARSTAYRRVQ